MRAMHSRWLKVAAGGALVLIIVVVTVFYFSGGPVMAAPGTSSSSAATGGVYQRKVVESSNGTIVAFFNAGTQSPTGISYNTSTDNGVTWGTATQVDSTNTGDFSVTIDSSDNIYVLFASSGSISSRKLTYSAGSWSVGSAVTVFSGSGLNCGTGSGGFSPSVAVSSSGTLIVSFNTANGGACAFKSSRSTNSGTSWSAAYGGIGIGTIGSQQTAENIAVGNDMWAVSTNSLNNLTVNKDIGSTGSWSSASGTLSTVDFALHSTTSSTSNTLDVLYKNSSNSHIEYAQYSISGASFGSVTTISSATSDVIGTLTAGSSGQLTAYYQEFQASNSYKVAFKSFDGVSTWSNVDYVSGNTSNNTNISSPVNMGASTTGRMGLIWTTGTATPWTVNGSSTGPPATPTLSAPASGATGVSLTPTFQLKTTNIAGSYAQYEILVYQSDCSTLVRTIDETASQTGWSGQDAQSSTAYTVSTSLGSSTTASHAYQSPALNSTTTYCWKAAAISPSSSSNFSSFSATQLFTTLNVSPNAPTLTKPVSGETGVSTTPEFRLYSTDQDNDYIRYEIDIYDSTCTTPITGSPFDQNASQTGWSSQNLQSGTAYSSGQTAIYKLQTPLTANTQYCWKARAKDPGGTNTFGSFSGTQLFTTQTSAGSQINIGGGTSIYSGTTINP